MKTQVYIAEVLPANFHQQEICCVGKRSTLTLQFSTRRKIWCINDPPASERSTTNHSSSSVTAANHNWGASTYVAELKPQFLIGITVLFQYSFLLCNLCWLFSNVFRCSLCSSDNNRFYWFCYPTLVPRKCSSSAWSEVCEWHQNLAVLERSLVDIMPQGIWFVSRISDDLIHLYLSFPSWI